MKKVKTLIYTISILLGATGGYIYWKYVGCLTGTCPTRSNVYLMVGYGILLGYTLADFVYKFYQKKQSSNI